MPRGEPGSRQHRTLPERFIPEELGARSILARGENASIESSMKRLPYAIASVLILSLAAAFAPAEEKSVNPKIREMIDLVSEARIKAILEKLESFETRNTMSNPDDPKRGVGAARAWILKEMQSYSPRLQVRFEKFR